MSLINDYEDDATLMGAVGGVPRDEIPLIVMDLVDGMDADLEIHIRPERVSSRYAIEWAAMNNGPRNPEIPWFRGVVTDIGQALRERLRQLLNRLTAIVDAVVPTFNVDRTRINLFAIDDRYLFKHYFEQEGVFGELRPYYNGDEYRFEVPEDAIDDVRKVLREHFFEPVLVQEVKPFCVVQPRYSDHPDVLFKASVLERARSEHHVFLMKDQLSVEQAVNAGAEKLMDSDVTLPF